MSDPGRGVRGAGQLPALRLGDGNIPSTLEDAARAAGASPLRAVLGVVLPLMRPSLIYCILLNFILNSTSSPCR